LTDSSDRECGMSGMWTAGDAFADRPRNYRTATVAYWRILVTAD